MEKVGVEEEEWTKNYIKLVLAPEMGQGIMLNTARESPGISFFKLSVNPEKARHPWWLLSVLCLVTVSYKLMFIYLFCPLPSARQHPSYGDCLVVKREYYQNSSVLDCVAQCSQSAAHLYEQFLQVQQIGFVTLDPYAVHRGGCLELYYSNMVEWFWWDSSLILTTSFLQCFDTVGLVIWPVKIVSEITYYVSSGTLNPTHSLTLMFILHLATSYLQMSHVARHIFPVCCLCRIGCAQRRASFDITSIRM